MKVRELKGFKSLKALNVFHSLILGLKMLPMYRAESYEEFCAKIQAMEPQEQEKMIREAALFVELQRDEVEAMCVFVEDPNGVPYGPANLNSMGPQEIMDIVVAVCMEVAKIKVDFISEDEKKNLSSSP